MTHGGLSKTAIQTVAVLAMIADHASVFFANTPYYYVMRFFGRITIIVMSYFVAEGFYKTRNLGRYVLRLGVFAAISQIPYWLYLCHGQVPERVPVLLMSIFNARNVIFTLFVGLCLLTIVRSDFSAVIKVLASLGGLYLVRNSDWSYYGVLWVVGFGVLYGSKANQILWLVGVLGIKISAALPSAIATVVNAGALTYGMLDVLVMFGGFFAVSLIASYNGEKGRGLKYGFYVLYPLQFLIILAIELI